MFATSPILISCFLCITSQLTAAELTLKLTSHAASGASALAARALIGNEPVDSRDIEVGYGTDGIPLYSSSSQRGSGIKGRSRPRRLDTESDTTARSGRPEAVSASADYPHLILDTQESGGIAHTIDVQVGGTSLSVLVGRTGVVDEPH
jgi:hypothetical protein